MSQRLQLRQYKKEGFMGILSGLLYEEREEEA
jgi:hypothetical protein